MRIFYAETIFGEIEEWREARGQTFETLADVVGRLQATGRVKGDAVAVVNGEVVFDFAAVSLDGVGAVLVVGVPGQFTLTPEVQNRLRMVGVVLTNFAAMLIGEAMGGVRGAVARTVVSLLGIFVWQRILPPAAVKPAQGYALRAVSNEARLFGVVPYVFGRFKYYPPLAARPFTVIEGNEQFIHVLLALGVGDIEVETIRVGEVEVERLAGVRYDIFRSDDKRRMTFYGAAFEVAVGAELKALKTVVLDGGGAVLDVGETISQGEVGTLWRGGSKMFVGTTYQKTTEGVAEVRDTYTDTVVDRDKYTVDYSTGRLTYSGGEWADGTARWAVTYVPADRAVESGINVRAQQLSFDLEALDGIYREGGSGTSTVKDEALVIFRAEYRAKGAARWRPYIRFRERNRKKEFKGGTAFLQLPIVPITRVRAVVDLTGDDYWTGTQRALAPWEYSVDKDTGRVYYSGGDWPAPPWRYEERNEYRGVQMLDWDYSENKLVVHIDPTRILLLPRPGPLTGEEGPILAGSVEVWHRIPTGAIPPLAQYKYVQVGADKYDVNYTARELVYKTGAWPMPWVNGDGMPAYLIKYKVGIVQKPERWRVYYSFDPSAVWLPHVTVANVGAWLSTARADVAALCANIRTVLPANRKITATLKNTLILEIERVQKRLSTLDKFADIWPTAQAVQDYAATGDGLGTLKVLIAGMVEIEDMAASPIEGYIERAASLVGAVDCLTTFRHSLARTYGSDAEKYAAMQYEIERYAQAQWDLGDAYGDPWALINEEGEAWRDMQVQWRGADSKPLRRSFSMHPLLFSGYDVRFERDSYEVNNDKNKWQTKVTVAALRALRAGDVVKRGDVWLLGLRLRAQEALNGTVERVSVIARRKVKVWNGGGWVAQFTANPCWVALDILLGNNARRPLEPYPTFSGGVWSSVYLNMPSFLAWAAYCDDKGIEAAGVIEEAGSVLEALEMLATVGRANFTIVDGRLTVVVDKERAGAVQLFTARNVKDFRITAAFIEQRHAIRFQFKDEAADYADAVVTAYADGYNADGSNDYVVERLDGTGTARLRVNWGPIAEVESILDTTTNTVVDPSEYTVVADGWEIERTGGSGVWEEGAERWRVIYWAARQQATVFEDVDIRGVSRREVLWRLGRYMLAGAQLRPRLISWRCDWEGILCTVGDRVRVSHFAGLIGLRSARVVEVVRTAGGAVERVRIDDTVIIEAGKTYAAVVRASDGAIVEAMLASPVGETDWLVFGTPFAADVARGDVVAFGEKEKVTRDVVVVGMDYDANLGCTITAVDYNEAVYKAETAPIPAFDAGITLPPPEAPRVIPTPEIVEIYADERAVTRAQNRLVPGIGLLLKTPNNRGDAMDAVEVLAQLRFTTDGTAAGWWDAWRGALATQILIAGVRDKTAYDVRVRYIARNGLGGEWATVEGVVVNAFGTPPPEVENLRLVFNDLVWDYSRPPIDLAGYMVRWVPGDRSGDEVWASGVTIGDPILTETRAEVSKYLNVGAGTFAVKAIDAAGNESAKAARLFFDGEAGGGVNVVWAQHERDYFLLKMANHIVTRGEVIPWIDGGPAIAAERLASAAFWGDDSAGFWGDDSDIFWGPDIWGGLTYEWEATVPMVNTRRDSLACFIEVYPSDFGWGVMQTFVKLVGGWAEIPRQLTVEAGRTYRFRLKVDPLVDFTESRFVVTDIKTVVDVDDIVMRLTDVEITDAANGVRIEPDPRMTQVVEVVLTQRAPSAARSLVVVDRTVTTGIIIKAYDGSGAATTARFDAVIRGY